MGSKEEKENVETQAAPETSSSPETVEEYKEPVVPSDDPKITANVAGSKAADALFEMAEGEPTFKDHMNKRFWEKVRDRAIKEVGLPIQKPFQNFEPLDDDGVKSLLKMRMEDGQYLDKRVEHIAKTKAGLAYLEEYSTRPSRFQKKLLRWFARGTKKLFPGTKPKTEKKTEKPKEAKPSKPKAPKKEKKVKTAKMKPIKYEEFEKPKKSKKKGKKRK